MVQLVLFVYSQPLLLRLRAQFVEPLCLRPCQTLIDHGPQLFVSIVQEGSKTGGQIGRQRWRGKKETDALDQDVLYGTLMLFRYLAHLVIEIIWEVEGDGFPRHAQYPFGPGQSRYNVS